jgi:VIT1/CCC1 family predicted Fe2+/Mn2+ transporter
MSLPRSRHRDVGATGVRAAVLGAKAEGESLAAGDPSWSWLYQAGTRAFRLTDAGTSVPSSMAAGELVSVQAQEELIEHEVEVEREELADDPRGEESELAEMYEAKGIPAAEARTVADILMSNRDVALDTHVRLELGVDPREPPSAWQAAIARSSFSLGAFIPLFPWLFWSGATAIAASIVLGAVAAVGLGAAIGAFTGSGVARTALRQLAAATIAATVTFAVGRLFDTATT